MATLSLSSKANETSNTLIEKEKEKDKNKVGLIFALKKLNKKLIVLDLNGLLIHRAHRCTKLEIPPNRQPDCVSKQRFVYKRPFLEEFLKFCLERFEVGIWSSAKGSNIDDVLDNAFKGLRTRFMFVWDQNRCTDSGFKSVEKKYKPLYFKNLHILWQVLDSSSSGEFIFSESNTLLIDDEPYKGLLNPPNTGIYPSKYDAKNLSDNVLDPKKELCTFLEGLAEAKDVPSYVKANTFGQPAIGPHHPKWNFYSFVLQHSGIFRV